MNSHNKTVLYIYRKLLMLYPQSYRRDYEDEMVETMKIMLSDAEDEYAKWSLLWRACKDYFISLSRQHAEAFDMAAAEAPTYIVQSSKFGTGLIMPFFIVCLYNSLTQYIFHAGIPYLKLESKIYIIYCVILPIVAGAIIGLASLRYFFNIIKKHRNRSFDWLLLSVPAMLIVTLILL